MRFNSRRSRVANQFPAMRGSDIQDCQSAAPHSEQPSEVEAIDQRTKAERHCMSKKARLPSSRVDILATDGR
jgi:hypothetical protein